MADDTVILHNTNATFKQEVFAADGDSVHIMPNSKQPVDRKFLWNLPKGVVQFGEYETTFSKKKSADAEQKLKVKDVTEVSGNTANPEDGRNTLHTDVKPAVVKK